MPDSRDDEIFDAVLALPADERAGCLDRACARDTAQRARVAALLRGHDEAKNFLAAPLIAPPAVRPREQTGERIGRYTLREKIGEGGCGVVWRAEQREPVKREVALKVIKLGMDTKEVIARFEAERQALALMDHPNIARVFDGGATESGRPYFVMELVRGTPITKSCEEHALGLRERIELFIAVCEAVQHAHQKGIIHRDLKPSNILVAGRAGPLGPPMETAPARPAVAPYPKVIDFGIAKATQGRLTDHTLHTAMHQFIGTPAYMSPEQAKLGGGADIDTRTDIYSLGVLLYELLTGETPFERSTLEHASVEEIRERIRTVEPLRPSVRVRTRCRAGSPDPAVVSGAGSAGSGDPALQQAPASHAAELRGDLDWIVMRCLEKDRARRYESANALAADLRRHLAHEPVAARPPSTAYALQKLIRRHRVAFAGAAAIAAVLVLGIIVSTWQAVRASRAERLQSQLRIAAQEAQTSEAFLRRVAEAQELAMRRRAYAADMNLLQQALASDRLGLAREILDRQRPQPGEADLRGWEWRYHWQFCRSDAVFRLCQKPSIVNFLAASPDGEWLAVGSGGPRAETAELSLWNLRTRTETRLSRLPAFACAAFSSRAPLLAYGTDDPGRAQGRYHVRLWHLLAQKSVGEITLRNECGGLAFSADGETLIATGKGEQNEISLWRVTDGTLLAAYPAPNNAARSSITLFAMTSDASLCAVQGRNQDTLRVVDLRTGQTRWTAKAADEVVLSAAFSPVGTLLASGAAWSESTIRLWDVASGREVGRLEGQRSFTRRLAFWDDGRTLVSINGDQTVRVWDVSERRLLTTLRGHTDEVHSLALLPDQRTIISGGKEGDVLFWDRTAVRAKGAFARLPKTVTAWSFAPDGSVVSIDYDGRVERWSGIGLADRETRLELGAEYLPTDRSEGLQRRWQHHRFARDAPLLATTSRPGEVCVWDWQRGIRMGSFETPSGPADPIEFLQRGERLVLRFGEIVTEWDWARGRQTRSWTVPAEFLGFTPDGQRMIISGDERRILISSRILIPDARGAILVHDLATGTQVGATLPGGSNARMSPDGRFIATTGPGNAISLWDAKTFAPVARLPGGMIAAESVVFSPDSQRLAAGSAGIDAVKLWDVESRENVLTLDGDGSLFWQTEFSANGNLLGSSNMNSGILHVWRAPSWAEIEAAEKEGRWR